MVPESAMSSLTPLIGITADRVGHPEEEGQGAYIVRRNYADAVAQAGGLAVILPYDPSRAGDYAARIDGLLVTGGRFDLPPDWYGQAPRREDAVYKDDRSQAERALIAAGLDIDLPILGVCNGMQLLGVMHGAPFTEHIPHEVPYALNHWGPDAPLQPRHMVQFDTGSSLAAIAGALSAGVNSVHHQAIRPASGFRVAATAADGVVEAIEIPGRRFCYGLQWHPEYEISPVDTAILKAFVSAAAEHREQRAALGAPS
jgi:putative glutamine amidotransferase